MILMASIVALICTGLVAGIFLGHRAGVSLAMPILSPSSFVQLQQIIHRTFARMMPVLNIGSVLSSVLWAVLQGAHGRTGEFWLVSAASLLMICIFAVTLGINVPINKQLMTWNPAAPPQDLSTLWAPWERVHSTRTGLAIVAFVAEVIAVASFRSP
jgi:uncharacterized membrane protein